MDDEQYRRSKEEEKEHLRELRSLKQAARLLQRQRSITQALEEMTNRSRAVLEENERLVEEIAYDAARQEARLDVVLSDLDPEKAALERASEEILQASIREQVRRELSESDGPNDAPEATGFARQGRSERERRSAETGESALDGPGTTSRAEPDPKALPEKTLGRMR